MTTKPNQFYELPMALAQALTQLEEQTIAK